MKQRLMVFLCAMLAISFIALPIGTATATVVTLDVNGYGYNNISGGVGDDGLPGAIGCGPTTGAMIMEYWSRNGAPGLITDLTAPVALADARLMGAGPLNPVNTFPLYMNTNSGGFGPSSQFQFGFESFAAARGYDFNAAIHVAPDSDGDLSDYSSSSGWNMYTFSGADQNIFADVNFWESDWQINQAAFINFIKPEIDAGRPLSASVYGDPNYAAGTILNTGSTFGGATHWMPIVGYNDVTNQWAGYNTWDSTLHWYTPTSAFYDTISGGNFNVPNMSIAYVRTFDLINGGNGNGTSVPEPATMLLLGLGLIGLAGARRKFKA